MPDIKTGDRVAVKVTANGDGNWQVTSIPSQFFGITSALFTANDLIHGYVAWENGTDFEVYDSEDDTTTNLLTVLNVTGTVVIQRPATPYRSTNGGARVADASGTHTLAIQLGAGTLKRVLRATNPTWKTFTSADITPSVADHVLFKTNGTTTIQRFDDGVTGQFIYVQRGDSDITIQNNADIETSTGADITLTASNPFACFIVDTDGVAVQFAGGAGALRADLAASGGAARVGIADAGSKYTGTTVEAALQEASTTAEMASTDPASGSALVGYDGGTTVKAALDTLFSREKVFSILESDVGGTANAITLTLSGGPALSDGLMLSFLPSADNTGAVTIDYNGGGAVALVDTEGNALEADDLLSTAPVIVRYDDDDSTYRLVAGAGVGSGGTSVADKAALALLTASDVSGVGAVVVGHRTYGGIFEVTTTDISTEVAADTNGAIYVPFAGGDGSTGGFVRQVQTGTVNPGWFGTTVHGEGVSAGEATNNAQALYRAILYLDAIGGGAITWFGVLTIDGSQSGSFQNSHLAMELRTSTAIVGAKPENGYMVYVSLNTLITGTVLRMYDNVNKSMLGARNGNKAMGIYNLFVDGNRLNNVNPGNHGIEGYETAGGNGHMDALTVENCWIGNFTGWSVYLYDCDPSTLTKNALDNGFFSGSMSDMILADNQISGAPIRGDTFDASTISGNTFDTSASHGWVNGLKVYYDNNGNSDISGLTDGNSYYIINATRTTFQVSATYGGSAVTVSAGSGTHLFWPFAMHNAVNMDGSNYNHIDNNITFAPAQAPRTATFTADNATNRITVSDWQGFLYDGCPLIVTSDGTLPAGLNEYRVYYARQVSGTTWELYDAPNTAATIDAFTDNGTGTHTVQINKYGCVFQFSGSRKGQKGITITGNRFAGSWGPGVVLMEMGFNVHWDSSNTVYETYQDGVTSGNIIKEEGTNVAQENIGFPYEFTFSFNADDATGGDAPLSINQFDFVDRVRQENEPTGGIWRVFFNRYLENANDFKILMQEHTAGDFRQGAVQTNGSSFMTVDIYTYDPATTTPNHPNIEVPVLVRHKGMEPM